MKNFNGILGFGQKFADVITNENGNNIISDFLIKIMTLLLMETVNKRFMKFHWSQKGAIKVIKTNYKLFDNTNLFLVAK